METTKPRGTLQAETVHGRIRPKAEGTIVCAIGPQRKQMVIEASERAGVSVSSWIRSAIDYALD